MSPYLVVVLVAVGVVLLLAYLSDRRDRRNDVDPKLRAQALVERRRGLRRRRVEAVTRRRTANPGIDPHERKPWER